MQQFHNKVGPSRSCFNACTFCGTIINDVTVNVIYITFQLAPIVCIDVETNTFQYQHSHSRWRECCDKIYRVLFFSFARVSVNATLKYVGFYFSDRLLWCECYIKIYVWFFFSDRSLWCECYVKW